MCDVSTPNRDPHAKETSTSLKLLSRPVANPDPPKALSIGFKDPINQPNTAPKQKHTKQHTEFSIPQNRTKNSKTSNRLRILRGFNFFIQG